MLNVKYSKNNILNNILKIIATYDRFLSFNTVTLIP
jgi:hypothetical protein